MTEKESQLLANAKRYLSEMSDALIEVFTLIKRGDLGLRADVDKGLIQFIDFEFNPDGFSITLYPMDRDWTQLGHRSLLQQYPNGIMSDKGIYLDLNDYDFDNEEDMERMEKFDLELEYEFINWFIRCWAISAEIESEFSFYLTKHDSNKSFDLSKNEWIQHKDK